MYQPSPELKLFEAEKAEPNNCSPGNSISISGSATGSCITKNGNIPQGRIAWSPVGRLSRACPRW